MDMLDVLEKYLARDIEVADLAAQLESLGADSKGDLSRSAFLRLKKGDPREARKLLRARRKCSGCSGLPEDFGHPDPDISEPEYRRLLVAVESGALFECGPPSFDKGLYADPRYLGGSFYLCCTVCGTVRSVTAPYNGFGAGGYVVA
jgi:hypothetical protein